jgi:predicted porin
LLLTPTIDHAGQRVDELASPADIDGGDGNMAGNGTAATANTINWLLPAMVDGLTANVSYSLQDNDASNAADNEVDASAVGLQYTTGGLTFAYAQQDEEGEAFTTTYTGLRYSVAGLSVGIDQATDKTADGDKHTTMGASYAVTGDTTVYIEANDIEDSAADEDTDIVGILYNVGGGLNVRVENIDSSTAANDETTIAVLYAF